MEILQVERVNGDARRLHVGADLIDTRAVRSVSATDEERGGVQPEHVATFGGGGALKFSCDRHSCVDEILRDPGGLVTTAVLPRSKEDRSGVGHQRGVVGIDRIGVTGDRRSSQHDLGTGVGQSSTEGRVFVDGLGGVRRGTPVVGLPYGEVVSARLSDVDAAKRADGVLDGHPGSVPERR